MEHLADYRIFKSGSRTVAARESKKTSPFLLTQLSPREVALLEQRLANALPGSMPPEIRPFREATPGEKKRRALRVLLEARRLYKARAGDLHACLSDGSLESWWAKEILRGIVGELNLSLWEQRCYGGRAEVYRVLDRAIRKCRRLRGGWFVSPRVAA